MDNNYILINNYLDIMKKSKSKRELLDTGISLANEIMCIFGVSKNELLYGEDALDNAFENSKFGNQRIEQWFEKHPYMGTARIALYHYKGILPVESNFFQLTESATKAKISAITQLTSNWEDSTLTMIPNYKVGIDFSLSSDASSLKLIITSQGKLRILELSEKLSNTQIEIFENIKGCFLYDGIDSTTGNKIPYEPQRTIHRTLWNAFELQQVNRKFYNGIADHFVELYQHIILNPPSQEKLETIRNESRLFASRLLGRLLFLWFLKKKNIINENKEYFIVGDLTSNDYYKEKLKKLFFFVLNSPQELRDHDDVITPYLNGGLFEPHTNDWIENNISFPENWFNTLYQHFNKFNFTTDESTPDYEQVAIDPEMLGRVFENLLASIRPETEAVANERSKKGAFYTPREIVSFMNKETLKEYLKTFVDNPKDNEGIDKLIEMNDAKYLENRSTGLLDLWGNRTDEVRCKIFKALDVIKVIDPACGSGAFPIGMMQLLVKTYERLSATYDAKTEMHRVAGSNETPNYYLTKLAILKNNLYGVDIEPMAIEIARLRSWLSLIVEDEGEIEPLPNLDFNFVCANTLLPLDNSEYQISIFDNFEMETKFESLRNHFFGEHDKNRKLELKNDFKNLYDLNTVTEDGYRRINQLKSWNPFETTSPAMFFDSKTMFNLDGFDIVIGNPPYIGEKGNKDIFDEVKKSSLGKRFYMGKMDYFYFFYHIGLDLLKNNGVLSYITTNYFPTADNAKLLRSDFFARANIKKITNFKDTKIFDSAKGQHNVILLLQKKGDIKNDFVVISTPKKSELKSSELAEFLNGNKEISEIIRVDKDSIFHDILTGEYFIRLPELDDMTELILEKIKQDTTKLGCITHINQGIISGADSITSKHLSDFKFTGSKLNDGIFVYEKGKLEQLEAQKELIKPFFKSTDINRWYTNNLNSKELLYLDGSYKPSDRLFDYLEQFKPILEKRREFINGKRDWYNLWWPRQLEMFISEKIVVCSLSKRNDFAINNIPWFANGGSQGGVFFITRNDIEPIDLYYLLGILNSNLMYFWLFHRAKRKGQYLALSGTPLKDIPIKMGDDVIKQKIVNNVKSLLESINNGNDNIRYFELVNNQLIFSLYDLNKDETSIIEKFVLSTERSKEYSDNS